MHINTTENPGLLCTADWIANSMMQSTVSCVRLVCVGYGI